MAFSPPAKRQRRSTIVLSDDEDDELPSKARLPLRESTRPTATIGGRQNTKSKAQSNRADRIPLAKPSPKSSPEKSRASKAKKEPEKNKSLHTFFGKATEEQRWSRGTVNVKEEIEDAEFGDAIVDDDSSLEEALLDLAGSRDLTREVHPERKGNGDLFNKPVAIKQQLPPATQRFVKPTIPAKRPTGSTQAIPPSQQDHRPWSDRYAPLNLDELAVHKKKVSDTQKWLTDVSCGRDRRRLLVLKGPAGSGKSITLSLLARLMGLQIVSWTNPAALEAGVTTSVAQQFDEFLNRGGRFSNLVLDSPAPANNIDSAHVGKVLVIEEFPTTMTRSSLALDSFRSVLHRFLNAGGPPQPAVFDSKQADSHPPLVMIITETLLTSTTASTDSFTAHRLLGPEISNHPLVTVMEFNAVAPTFVAKALDIVIKKEARDSQRRRTPGPAVLQTLADMGDIRSAINSLEFLCVRGDDTADWSGTVAGKVKRGSKNNVTLTNMEQSSLQLVSLRETTLDIFHAAGKVVYNKREDPRRSEQPLKPPDHLMHFDKPKVSQVDIEALLAETGTDIQTFLSALHENYVLSCNGSHFLESFDGCADLLSNSDVLSPSKWPLTRSRQGGVRQGYSAVSTDLLRQDEISFQVATRGLLFNLPFPVSRAAHPGGQKGDSFKMFYPASLRLWKPMEEIEGMISLCMPRSQGRMQNAGDSEAAGDGVALWSARASGGFFEHGPRREDNTEDRDVSTRVYTSRDDMTLEILPYLGKIKSSRREDVRTLNKITQFHGAHIAELAEEPFDEDMDETQQSSSGSQNSRIANALSRFSQARNRSQNHTGAAEDKVDLTIGAAHERITIEKLYISDDDIQDD